LREQLLEANPILWLAGRYRLKRVLVLVSLGALGASWSLLAWKYPRGMLDPSVYLLSAYVAQTMLKLWVASEAVLLFGEDRRTGALELVLSTPLKVDAICEGQIQALERQFGWPVMIVLCLDLVMFVASSMEQIPILLSLGIVIVFVTDLYTLAWVGLWLGLTAKRTNRALRGAIGRVLVLPWLIFLVGLFLFATNQTFEPNETGLLVSAFVLSMANAIVFGFWARTNLTRHMRLAATQRFESEPVAAFAPPPGVLPVAELASAGGTGP
jgi:hypothetical protein